MYKKSIKLDRSEISTPSDGSQSTFPVDPTQHPEGLASIGEGAVIPLSIVDPDLVAGAGSPANTIAATSATNIPPVINMRKFILLPDSHNVNGWVFCD
jgi:hypothetical protein